MKRKPKLKLHRWADLKAAKAAKAAKRPFARSYELQAVVENVQAAVRALHAPFVTLGTALHLAAAADGRPEAHRAANEATRRIGNILMLIEEMAGGQFRAALAKVGRKKARK